MCDWFYRLAVGVGKRQGLSMVFNGCSRRGINAKWSRVRGLASVQARHECEKYERHRYSGLRSWRPPGNENDGGAKGRGRQWDFCHCGGCESRYRQRRRGFSTFSMTEVARPRCYAARTEANEEGARRRTGKAGTIFPTTR